MRHVGIVWIDVNPLSYSLEWGLTCDWIVLMSPGLLARISTCCSAIFQYVNSHRNMCKCWSCWCLLCFTESKMSHSLCQWISVSTKRRHLPSQMLNCVMCHWNNHHHMACCASPSVLYLTCGLFKSPRLQLTPDLSADCVSLLEKKGKIRTEV